MTKRQLDIVGDIGGPRALSHETPDNPEMDEGQSLALPRRRYSGWLCCAGEKNAPTYNMPERLGLTE